MTPILLALAALQAAPADPAATQFKACTALVREAPDKAIAAADAWRLGGGGLDARHCLGLAYFAAQRFAPAAAAFEQAAREAETKKDSRVADFWTQSGNAWLAGGDGAQAIKAFDAALGLTGLILTKLDGTAKGGVVCAIAKEKPVPLLFIGVGEGIDDLRPFAARDFAEALVG